MRDKNKMTRLGDRKLDELMWATNRHIAVAIPVDDDHFEFITDEHEHFLFNRAHETFSRIPDDEVEHWNACKDWSSR